MKSCFEEYKDDKIVKSLLDLGFSEDYIEKAIENGEIKLEKSCMKKAEEVEEDDKEEEVKEEVVEEKSKDKKKSCDKEDCEETKMDEKLQKSFDSFNETISSFKKSIELLNDKIDRLGQLTPNFKSEGLNNIHAIEKSFRKDENDKYEVDIIRQRPVACKLISNAIESSSDEISKSLQDDALAFLTNPEADTVGENLARYMYNKGVKFVK